MTYKKTSMQLSKKLQLEKYAKTSFIITKCFTRLLKTNLKSNPTFRYPKLTNLEFLL